MNSERPTVCVCKLFPPLFCPSPFDMVHHAEVVRHTIARQLSWHAHDRRPTVHVHALRACERGRRWGTCGRGGRGELRALLI
jgi:hypothetical protein